MNITIDTTQLQVLEDFFGELSNANQKKVFMAGFRRASKPLVIAAKSHAPKRTGNLVKSIGTIAQPNDVAIIVGAKKGGRYKGWHGHLIENGTKERFRKSGGATGRVNGTHFFENAFNATSDQVYSEIEQSWYEEIDNFIVKTNKKLK